MRSSSELTDATRTQAATCAVLGVEYFVGDLRSAADVVLARVREGGGGYSCLCGVHGIVTAQHSRGMMESLHGSWMNFPDGAPVAWLMRRFGARDARRIAGPDLMPLVFEVGQESGLRHFLYGSTPDVLDRLERRLRERYPRAIIAGKHSPPFRPLSDEENAQIAEEIAASGADIVWVGLGLPKQDQWLKRSAALFSPCLGVGVGAAFDFLAGTKPRAPRWVQRIGFEWLHRLASEPRRLARRYATTNTEFLARAGLAIAGEYARSARRIVARTGRGETE